MATSVRLDRVDFASVIATERTEWTFAEITDRRGGTALVEIGGKASEPTAVSLLAEAVKTLSGRAVDDESRVPSVLGLDASRMRADLSLASAVSALRSAVVQLQASHEGVGLARTLWGAALKSVVLYANVNRSLFATQRSPNDFAHAAERAVRRGFETVKCAPFDEVMASSSTEEVLAAMETGIRRVAAVREAVGSDVQVMVDCHSRFTAGTAVIAAERLAPLGVGWFEEPLDPANDVDGLQRVAEAVTMPVAGGEMGYGRDFFSGLLDKSAVSVVMPDVMYCGGVAEAYEVGLTARRVGRQVSLHCPSGPVSLLASAHVTAGIPVALPLEHAVDEVPWRAEMLVPPERVDEGRLWLPEGPGLGATLDWSAVDRHGRRWRG